MFLAHFAVGFASKRWAPRTSLAVLMIAPLLADVIWPVLVLLGVELVRVAPGSTVMQPLVFDSYPWSHSLAFDAIWAALFGGAVYAASCDRAAALVVALGVVSHWLLDAITHAPDMPVWPGGPRVGLGLWDSPAWTVAVETLLFAAGVTVYVRATRAKDRTGTLAFASLVGVLALLYVASIAGPPPPGVGAVAWAGITAGILFPAWAWWADRHREPAPTA